jgi:hypothetical protein
MYDAVRGAGAGKMLATNQASAEGVDSPFTDTDYGFISSFDSDGFSLDDGAVNGAWVNNSGTTYVAWNWLAGNGTASNTDGSITSTVSVNQKAGFSVVSYTGNGAADASVGHGLGIAPSFFIVKNRTTSTNWPVYHKSLPAHDGGNYPTNSLRLKHNMAASADTLSAGAGSLPKPTFKCLLFQMVQTSAGDGLNVTW